eukprot:jgi/Chrzof1/7364/Cz02g21040.t1
MFRPVPAIQLTGHQVILTANYLGCFLAHCRGISYREHALQHKQSPPVCNSNRAAAGPTIGPDLQIVPLKKTAGQAAHVLINVPSPEAAERLVSKGTLSKSGVFLAFEMPLGKPQK